MPQFCCIPLCKSNSKDSRYMPTFKFPNDDRRRQQWLDAIPRDNFVPSTYSGVCIKHFEERFIERDARVYHNDSTLLLAPYKYPRLKRDAFPTISLNPVLSTNTKNIENPKPIRFTNDKKLKNTTLKAEYQRFPIGKRNILLFVFVKL